MAKIKGWIAGCFGFGLLLAACDSSTNGGGSGGGSLSEADLVGKWSVTTVHTKGWETDDSGSHKNVDTVETYPAGTNTVEYKSDKTFSVSFGGFSFNGTWAIKGDSVISVTSILGTTDTSSAQASISGKDGTFTAHMVDAQEDFVTTTKATKQ